MKSLEDCAGVLEHNCRVGKIYTNRNCGNKGICNPVDVFDTIEKCKTCNKQQ